MEVRLEVEVEVEAEVEVRWRRSRPDDDTLVLGVDHHVAVHVVRQGIDVGRVLILGLGG